MFRSVVSLLLAAFVGMLPLFGHQWFVSVRINPNDQVDISTVSISIHSGCNDHAVTYQGYALSCDEVKQWDTIQTWAWLHQIEDTIEQQSISTEILELNTTHFHAGENLGQLRYPIYRLLLSQGYLDLTDRQFQEEVEYLIPELPFLVEWKTGDRLLTEPGEVAQWKTEIVQQELFEQHYIRYMLDHQTDIVVLSSDATVQMALNTPIDGYLEINTRWQNGECYLENQWWSKAVGQTTIVFPLYSRWVENDECSHAFDQWRDTPNHHHLSISVVWHGFIDGVWARLSKDVPSHQIVFIP